MKDYTNSQIAYLIDEHIHSERDRDIMKSRLINGLTFEQLAEKYEISPRQAKNIVYKCTDRVLKYL